MSNSFPGRPATPRARAAVAPESAARRQARLRALSALQREALAARWQHIAPAVERVDAALARVRRLREHPLALGVLALSATGLVASRRGRRVLATLQFGWRLGLRAATVASLWRAVRTLSRSTTAAAPDRRA